MPFFPRRKKAQPFLWDGSCARALLRPTPGRDAEDHLPGIKRGVRPYFGLAPGGACRAPFPAVGGRVALTPPFHPCRALPRGLISAALSLNRSLNSGPPGFFPGTPLPPWSPDFPLPPAFRHWTEAAARPPDGVLSRPSRGKRSSGRAAFSRQCLDQAHRAHHPARHQSARAR